MYEAYFKLKENPFLTNDDPRFYYLTPSHGESVAKCEYAIRRKSGLAVIYGDIGTGKTTMVSELRRRFNGAEYTIALVNNLKFLNSDTALLKAIAGEFGVKSPRTKLGTSNALQGFLAQEVAQGRTPLLFVDDAQDLDKKSVRPDRDMLGVIKALATFMLEHERLIHIILFGQMELIPSLKKRRDLMSRVVIFGALTPLTKDDAKAMLEHRWKIAGGVLPLPVSADALDLVYEATKGLPRDMVKVVNGALMHAFGARLTKATTDSAQYAIKTVLEPDADIHVE